MYFIPKIVCFKNRINYNLIVWYGNTITSITHKYNTNNNMSYRYTNEIGY